MKLATLNASNIEKLKSMSIETFELDTSIEYRTFVLTTWNGAESYYRKAGNAIRRMIDGSEPCSMHGITKEGTMVLIAAH